MKLSTITILAMLSASTNASANALDDDYYEDNLRPSEISNSVNMMLHGEHFEGMSTQTEMNTNMPICAEDAVEFDVDEHEA